MYNFQFFMPTKALFGAGQLKNLHLERMPGRKALIATSNGSSTKKYGYLESVEKELDAAGVEHVLFDEIRPNPTNYNVMDGASKARENDGDILGDTLRDILTWGIFCNPKSLMTLFRNEK